MRIESMTIKLAHYLKWMILLGPWCFSSLLANASVVQELRIGVLAYDGKAQAVSRWQPTADYLSRHVSSARFRIVPLTHQEFEHAINKNELSFVLTNPGHYARLEVAFGVTRIATFQSQVDGRALTQFSSVMFVRADSEIVDLEDMPGHTLAAVSEAAFGGFQLAEYALRNKGLSALEDMQVMWLGFPHADVVRAVLAGKADVGTVRSGTLEKMAARGMLDLSALRVIAPRPTPIEAEDNSTDFPFLRSAELYPEWPFSKLPSTDTQLAKQVAMSLLNMPADDEAAVRSGGSGWTIPLSYASVHQVLRRLQVEPYPPQPVDWLKFWRAYSHWMVIIGLLLLTSLFALMQLYRANRNLQVAQRELHHHQGELEAVVQQRGEELRRSNQALQEEVAFHARAEQTLNQGCEALQSLHAILVREDWDRQQRLDAIVESARAYLGAEFAVLSSYPVSDVEAAGRGDEGQGPEICSSSPSSLNVSVPLSIPRSRQAIKEGQLVVQTEGDEWYQYIASPVYSAGKLFCLFEFATSAKYHAEHRHEAAEGLSSELGIRIITLISQWLGNETVALEMERQSSARQQGLMKRFEGLTAREQQVLQLLVKGDSTKLMARSLKISTKTIELYRANLLRKTQAKSSTELVQLAVSSGVCSKT